MVPRLCFVSVCLQCLVENLPDSGDLRFVGATSPDTLVTWVLVVKIKSVFEILLLLRFVVS